MEDKIKLAVVGLRFGKNLLKSEYFGGKGRAEKYFQLTACCDIDKEKADSYGKQHNLNVYYDIDELLSSSDAEVVALFTGPNGRAKLLNKIITSGRDVITTKPFETDPQAAEKILKKARKLDRLIYMNSPNPMPPADVSQIIDWQNQYKLGHLVAVRFETWCRYNEQYDGSWYDDPEMCPLAPVFRLGIYGINDVLRFTSKPVKVQALGTRIFTRRKTDDNALLAISFEQGEIATFFASFCVSDNRPYPNKMTMNFEHATIQKNADLSVDVTSSTQLQLITSEDGRQITETAFVEQAKSSGCYMWEEFYKGFKNRNEPLVSDDIIVNSIKITQAMSEAASKGITVNL